MYTQNDWRFYQEYELYHHGIKGQKWGVSNGPPYPLGSAISTGKRLIGKAAGAIKRHKEKRIQAEAAKLKAKQEKEAQEAAERKEKILVSGNAAAVSSIASSLSDEELKKALDRVDLQKRLNDAMIKDADTRIKLAEAQAKLQAPSKSDVALAKIKQANEWVKTGTEAWNTFAKLYNSLSEDQIPVIDGQWAANQADKQRKKAKEEQELAEKQHKAKQEAAIKSWSNEEIAAHPEKFTTQQLQDRVKRNQAIAGIMKGTTTNDGNQGGGKKNKNKNDLNTESVTKTETPKAEPSYFERMQSLASEAKADGTTGWTTSAEKAARSEAAKQMYAESLSQYNKEVTRRKISELATDKSYENLMDAFSRNEKYLRHGMMYFEVFHDAFDLDAIIIG